MPRLNFDPQRMIRMESRYLARLLRMFAVCLSALLLAGGMAACGDDEGGSETVTVIESDTDATDTDATDTDATDTDATDTDLSDTETDTDSGSSEEDEVNAQAAVDALLLGIRQDDPNIVCGLLSEEYANQLTGQQEFGIAKCVENLRKADLGSVKAQLKGIEVRETEVDPGGDTATVTLTNGETVELKKDPEDPSRYVITAGLE